MKKAVSLLLVIFLLTMFLGSAGVAASTAPLEVQLVKNKVAAAIYVDPKGSDYDGLSLVARSFAGDVKLVTGITPPIITDSRKLKGTVLIAGSIGNNKIIDSLIKAGKLNVSAVKGKWETYKIQVVDHPVSGVTKAIVVAGSDKRGTIYGIYHISELIGVSPWVYWGDVVPAKQTNLLFKSGQLNFTSREPSVKYRGVFLNDEAPSLTSWCANKFGGLNEKFYDKLFEVILRLKGNYLWPAMWSNCFSRDGKSDPLANAKDADKYGIVMGASHHEPMCRAGAEWQQVYSQYGTSSKWDWVTNKAAITKFWDDGIKRNGAFENVITLGMRGENDTALMPRADMKTNIEVLKEVITTQKKILAKYGLSNAPKILVCYTEVLDYWYGSSTVPGLKDWDGLKDVTIVLPDDNNGNTRTLPRQDERNRAGGWGLYYHIDMHGGCRSYEWVDTVPLEKMHEQLSMAYDYGCKNLWIVNVGDFKPDELSISYLMDLAYDFNKYGTNGINKTAEYTRNWVRQQFGSFAGSDTINGIADVLSGYLRLNQANRPEITTASTFSASNYNEALRELAKANTLTANARKYYDLMPSKYKDAYYQLVYYPAVASANVRKMYLYTELNQKYYGFYNQSVLANYYAALAEQSIQTDKDLQNYYNNTLSGGKWKGMMSSPHVGYKTWDSTGWAYPTVGYMTPVGGQSLMIVDVEGGTREFTSGTTSLPAFTNVGNEGYGITISNGGNKSFDYRIEADANWIKLDNTSGTVQVGKTIGVSVDWSKVSAPSSGVITITGSGQTVKVNVAAQVISTRGLAEKTFVETNKVISIEAEHTSNRAAGSGAAWKTIQNYGRTLSSVKMYPDTVSFANYRSAPYLEYRAYTGNTGNYQLTTYVQPTNNLAIGSRLKYAVSVDGAAPVVADALPAGFVATGSMWGGDIFRNAHITTTSVGSLSKGAHTIRIYGLDAGLVLQKLVLSYGVLPYSYYGPEESFYVGRTGSVHPFVKDVDADQKSSGLNLFPSDKMSPRWSAADAPFTEKNGVVAIKAETAAGRSAYATVSDTGTNGHTWSVVAGQTAGALQCLPDSGWLSASDAPSLTASPKLAYTINVTDPGKYTVWILAKAAGANADSVHVGLDNAYKFTNMFGINNSGNWAWDNTGTLDINAGTHELDFWAREDGLIIDRIYLAAGSSAAAPVIQTP